MDRSPSQNVRIVTWRSGAPELGYRYKRKNPDAAIWRLSYHCDDDIVLSHHHLRLPPFPWVCSNVDIKLSFSGSHQKRHVFTPAIVS